MSRTPLVVLSRVLALLMGIVWGFFVAFNVVFSDVFGTAQMLGAVLYVVVAYLGIGLVFGAAGPLTGWKWTWWLAPPGVVLVALTLTDAPDRIVYPLGVIAAIAASTLAGSWLGAYLRTRFAPQEARPAPDVRTPSIRKD